MLGAPSKASSKRGALVLILVIAFISPGCLDFGGEEIDQYLILKKKWEKLTESFLQNHYDPSYSSNTIKNDRKIIKLINAKTLNHSEISKIAKKILKK